jgi:DnaJ-class molecular chaperone
MADDYYKTLGVSRNASQADIQKAYRELARKHHPDMNPDDPSATKKFQQVQAAFDVLNNPEKREMYDRYGSSFETMGAGGPGGRPGPGPGPGFSGGAPGGFSFEDIDFGQFFGDRYGEEAGGGLGDIFSHFRKAPGRSGAGGAGGGARRRSGDAVADVEIPFAKSISGGEVQINLQRGSGPPETIVVKIPPGIEDGKKIRLRGQGEPASGRGTPGDLILTVHVAPHPFFSRRGNNLHARLPVTLGEAVGGATVDVPTPSGVVSLHVPPGASSGMKLRVKGHGVTPKSGPAGDLIAEVLIVLPKNLSDADRQALREIDSRYPLNPREKLRW